MYSQWDLNGFQSLCSSSWVWFSLQRLSFCGAFCFAYVLFSGFVLLLIFSCSWLSFQSWRLRNPSWVIHTSLFLQSWICIYIFDEVDTFFHSFPDWLQQGMPFLLLIHVWWYLQGRFWTELRWMGLVLAGRRTGADLVPKSTWESIA